MIFQDVRNNGEIKVLYTFLEGCQPCRKDRLKALKSACPLSVLVKDGTGKERQGIEENEKLGVDR